MKKLLISFLTFIALTASANTIEMVVTASPGGPDDTISRKIVEKLEKSSNLSFVVVNKPGAAHQIGYNYISQSKKPTLFIATNQIAENQIYSQVDTVSYLGDYGNIVFVNKDSGITNIGDLINLSKTRQINFGHGGVGSQSHRAMEDLCSKTLSCLPVPYKSGAEGMLGILSNTIDAYALVAYGANNFIANPKYIALKEIRNEKGKNWVKLFATNLSESDKDTVSKIIKNTDPKFWQDIGFWK
jgi:tripartite-type tricarboxylate transporter receptor subunit TctC